MHEKIILVNPPTRENAYRELKQFAFTAPPMGLAYIAAFLEEKGLPVDIIDSDASGLDLKQTIESIKEQTPKYVGVTAMTATMGIAGTLIKRLRRVLPEAMIILGGVHATALPKQTMEELPEIDVVVMGEGEHTAYELISALDEDKGFNSLAKVKGICFRKGDQIVENEKRPVNTDLDSLPFPARHLLPMDVYEGPGWFRWSHGYTKPFVPIFTARGCPYNCNFCASNIMAGRRVRYRSVENVMAEIDHLKETYGIKILSIEDDTFTLKKERAISICKELIKRNYKLHIMCETRVDQVNEELLHYMKRAGVEWLFFGVESGNQEILNRTRKGITLKQVRSAIRMTKKAGIGTHAGFILGHLGETKETAMQTIRFLMELMPDHTGIATLIPFPGSRIWDYCQENNIPLPQDWNDYGMVNSIPISINPGLNSKDILELRDKAIWTYHSNPKRILRLFKTYNKRLLVKDHLFVAYALGLRKIRQSMEVMGMR